MANGVPAIGGEGDRGGGVRPRLRPASWDVANPREMVAAVLALARRSGALAAADRVGKAAFEATRQEES